MAMDPPGPIACYTAGRAQQNGSSKLKKTGRGKTVSNGSATMAAKATRSNTSKSSTKKRKKHSSTPLGPIHSSVHKAQEWTNRAEQAEELRAREPMYLAPTQGIDPAVSSIATSSMTGSDKPTTTKIMVKVGNLPGATIGSSIGTEFTTGTPGFVKRKRAKRPWEWSANDCRHLLRDVSAAAILVHSSTALGEKDFAESRETDTSESLESAEAKTVSASSNSGGSCSNTTNVNGGGEMNVGNDHSESPITSDRPQNVQAHPRMISPVESTNPFEKDQPPPENSKRMPDDSSAKGAADIHVMDEPHSGRRYPTRQRSTPASFNLRPSQPEHCNVHQTGHVALDLGPNPKPGEVGRADTDSATEDERKARELSALLNRNHPRRRARSDDSRAEMPPFSSTCQDLQGPIGAPGKNPVQGITHIGRSSRKPRRSLPGEDSSGAKNGLTLTTRRWLMNPGARAEVWWDNAWYRCTLYSVSGGGQRGVLEFLPRKSRRKGCTWGRECSTELDIDEWVRKGHLVRPRTHLEWE